MYINCPIFVKNLKKIPYRDRQTFTKNDNSTVCAIRNQISLLGKRILIDVQDFTSHVNQSYDDEVRKNLYSYLNSLDDLFSTIDVIIIEKQYHNPNPRGGGGKSNMDALMMGEFVYAYFIMKIQNNFFFKPPVLMFYPAKYKTEMWNAPAKMTKSKRKTWSGNTGQKILQDRNDTIGLKELRTKGIKKDDMGDCILMWLTFLCHYYLVRGIKQ